MKLGEPLRDLNSVQRFFKKVDDRRAKQLKSGLINSRDQPLILLGQRDDNVEFLGLDLRKRRLKICQPEKQKPRCKCKIFAQQTIPFKASRAGWQQGFTALESNPTNRIRPEIPNDRFAVTH